MATKQEAVPEPPDGPVDETPADVSISQWEFLDRIPTTEDVQRLLETLPPVWGVVTAEYGDYVQALPQNKKVKVPHPTNPSVMVDKYLDAYTLYMSVAGRLKMLERAAETNGWCVDFEPEPVTPTGVPGFISLEPKIVYREYVVISATTAEPDGNATAYATEYKPLGRKSGTAWVPASGGKNAAGSNPYEKVETSARGRAIAAWGFGVLPGSGVASVEEILGSRQNKTYLDAEAAMSQGGGSAPRKTRGDLLQEVLQVAEEVRQHRGYDEIESKERMGKYLSQTLGATGSWDVDAQEIAWDKVKDGQIQLLINSLRDVLRKIVASESGL